jgi:rhomboid protease GluP
MRIRYNSPVILTFTIASTVILLLDGALGHGLTPRYFIVYPDFDGSALSFIRLMTHVLGHKNWAHLVGNFVFILLIGPILEEKYRSGPLLLMLLITALTTGILNVLLFPTALMGASGIVFMLIILSSFTNFRAGEVPITFILIVVLFLTKELTDIFTNDDVSQFAHIIGGICGSAFGFLIIRSRRA